MLDLDQVLREAVDRGASDIHIKVGSPPHIRLDGELVAVSTSRCRPPTPSGSPSPVMPKIRAEEFIASNEADFAYALERRRPLPGERVPPARLGRAGAAAHPSRHPADGGARAAAGGAPPRRGERGLVLVTGPTGSGKTTTLAAMIDHINETQARHIVTIEDPIEVLHPDKKSIINQREVGTDTTDFLGALKRALRQDPDVILIGEMRDPETVWAALSAAETGHLVFSTLHTMGAAETINRVIDFFPPYQQQQVRMSLAGALQGHRVAAARAAVRPGRPGAGDGGARLDRARVRQDRRLDPDPRARGDHRRRRVLRDADVRPEPARTSTPTRWSRAATRCRPRRTRTTCASRWSSTSSTREQASPPARPLA